MAPRASAISFRPSLCVALQLGICPTTLKRACRRNGIRRWPRKQLIRMSKAMAAGKDEPKATGTSAGGFQAQAVAAVEVEESDSLS